MNPTQTLLLAAAEELDETKVSPGLLGFLVFAALGVAVWLLLRSMNRQISRVNFEERPERPEDAQPREAGRAGRGAKPSGAAASPEARSADGPAAG